MDQNNYSNFNATYPQYNFEYSAQEPVQLATEKFISNNDDVTIATSTSLSVGQPNSDDNLILSPPFPPNIDPKVLALELFNKGGKRTKKMLNEFFLFRKEFVRELKRQNLHPRQTKVSALASTSWHKQKPSVKDEYRRIAREVERLFMIERQREASVVSRAESNESSTDDSVPSPTEPAANHFSLPLSNLPSDDNISTILSNQNNVRLTSSYQEYPWYNHYDRQYIRPTNITPVTSSSSYRHNFNNYLSYDDQMVVPSQNLQNLQEFFTPNYSR